MQTGANPGERGPRTSGFAQEHRAIFWSLVGILASAAVVLSWAPQVRRILVTKKAEDISFGLPIILMIGSALWVAYGVHLGDLIIITVNTIVFFVNILIVALKRRYGASA